MDIFGSFALLLALAATVYAAVAGTAGILTRKPLLTRSARNAGMMIFPLVTLAVAALEYLFFTNNFSMAYVAEHSNRDLPYFYKFAALWSGQEGSLLFWSWLLSIYSFLALWINRRKHPELMPYVGVVLACVQFFFLLLNNFVATPFNVIAAAAGAGGAMHLVARADGTGLNPLLQYWEMVIHPPLLYLGYTGFSVPFAFGMAALLGRYPGEKWIHITRRWTMIAWGFLGCGVLLGAHWAYSVLGWGGYWGWDPVENAALLPWITGTAFLHSVMMQEKRGMMRVWNIWLIFVTFLLSILGTMLTRSGVVSSVHAFAQSSIGSWFVGFLIVAALFCVLAYWKNRDYLRSDNQLDAIVSRESSFLFNNLVLLAACFAVLWGTLFPVFSEWATGSKISVGAAVFQPRECAHCAVSAVSDGRGAAAGVAADFARQPATKFYLAGDRRGGCGWCGICVRVSRFLFGDVPVPGRLCDADDCIRILSRRARDRRKVRDEFIFVGGAIDAAQYAALRRIHCALRDGADFHRHCGTAVQSRRAEGHAAGVAIEHRAVHFAVPEF